MSADLKDFQDYEIEREFDRRKLWPEPDISDHDDDVIVQAYEERGLGEVHADPDIDRLAEMIASGANKEALALLCELHPGLHPATIRGVVASRGIQQERLF